MKKLIVAAAALAVAVIGFGALGTGPSATEAAPTSLVLVNCNLLPAGWCTTVPVDTATLPNVNTIGNLDTTLTASDLTTLAAHSAAQVSATQDAMLFAFVNDDSPVTFNTGTVLSINGGGDFTCDSTSTPTEADCDDNNTAGDGVVAVVVSPAAGAAVGDTQTITVSQGTVSLDSESIMVVGAAHNIALAPATATVQALSTDTCASTDPANTTVNQAAFAATVTDVDGNDLVGVPVTFTSGTTSVALVDAATGDSASPVVAPTTLTVNSAVGIAGFAVACGKSVGSSTISATVPGGSTNTATADLTVVGAPASIALSASPAAIPCDGTSTSTVTATVTDAGGNPVAPGTTVTFNVVALGTANPINATADASGVATSVITPLSGSTSGVVVNVVSGSAANSVRIDCLAALLTPTAPAGAATATPSTGVTGPNTGTGGYLGQDSSTGFPMWALAALALASVVLVGGGVVARRAGK